MDIEIINKIIDSRMVVNLERKRSNGEVFTPRNLIEKMLDKLPEHVWYNHTLKWFDPAVGIGNFMVCVYFRLMDGLKNIILDPDERRNHILDNMLYMSEIWGPNVSECKSIFNHSLNIFEGNTLLLNPLELWGINKFDIILGNPPFNSPEKIVETKRGHSDLIWPSFVKYCLKLLNDSGYFLFITPPGWRKPQSKFTKSQGLFKLMVKDNWMVYLEIHSAKDALRIFKVGTRYDIYLISKCSGLGKITVIKDEDGEDLLLDLNNLEWLPNKNISNVLKLLKKNNEEGQIVLCSKSNYDSRKDYVSDIQTDIFCFPLIHAVNKNEIRYKFSSRNDLKYFGTPKIIFSRSGFRNLFIDLYGDYGMTQDVYAFEIKSLEEGLLIKNALLSKSYRQIWKSCVWSIYAIDYRMFPSFKKEFWLDFV